jgi:hypothetical protein
VQNFLAKILDGAAAAETLSGLHLFFRGITPKPGISIIVRCFSAIALSQVFSRRCACSRSRGRTTWKTTYACPPQEMRSQNTGISSLGEPVLFQTKNNLKGEDLRYDCYYY